MGKRIAVIGASGFVGTALVEHAIDACKAEVVPIIHSTGNAWRLIRRGLDIRMADLLDRNSIAAALDGCTHVVNCSRGDDAVMLTGLRNMLDVAAERKIDGFLHLSSVMVYGDPPSPDSTTESGTTPRQAKASYGGIKLQQDLMVQRAAAEGLPSLILCPPNISGPYSYFLGGIIGNLRAGSLAILENGQTVCNVVDVYNLAHAIMLGLDHCTKQSPRLFITDGEDTTWGQIVEAVRPLYESASPAPSIDRAKLTALRNAMNAVPPINLGKSLKHLVASDIRAALRKDPLWAKFDKAVRQGVAKLGAVLEDKLRLAVEGPIHVAKAASGPPINVQLSAQQLRGVRHSCALAKSLIGYQPRYSFAQSMTAYRAWYRSHTGQNSRSWALARYLWQ